MNDVLRLIAGGLLALISCYGGVLIKKKYKERETFFSRAEAFASVLSTEIGLHKTPIPDVVSKFATSQKEKFDVFLVSSLQQMREGAGVQELIEKCDVSILKKDEKNEICTFLSSLGKTALDDQMTIAKAYEKIFDDKKKKCANESKQFGNMYFKLSVLLGLALILILS